MSASREKKQRQASGEPVVSSRAQEEKEKAARRKRNTIIYSVIGIVVAILAAILLIWDSGVFQRNATVATINGEKVTAPQVAYYYYSNPIFQTAQMYAQYAQYGLTTSFSLDVSPKEQLITDGGAVEYGLDAEYVGKTYHEYFLDYALNSLREEYALRAAAEKAGYTLSDEGKESVEQELAALDDTLEQYLSVYGADLSRSSYLQMIYGATMNERKFRSCLENSQLAVEFYTDHFDTLAGYSEEELDGYYQAHRDAMDTVTYYWRLFDGAAPSTTDEEGNTVEPTEEESAAALAAAKEEAEAALAEVEADPDLVKDSEEYTEATSLLQNASSLYYDWLVDPARQPGDAAILDGTTGTSYYLVVFGERFRDETPTVNVRHILVEATHDHETETEEHDHSTDSPTDEEFAAARQTTEELLAQWKAGEATEESFAALAEEHSADPGSNTNGGLYEKVAEGSIISNFNDWIFDPARQSGDVSEPIQNTESSTQGWHLIYYIGQDEPVWKTSARAGLWADELEANSAVVRTDKLDLVAE